jgi:hypothetical protein
VGSREHYWVKNAVVFGPLVEVLVHTLIEVRRCGGEGLVYPRILNLECEWELFCSARLQAFDKLAQKGRAEARPFCVVDFGNA